MPPPPFLREVRFDVRPFDDRPDPPRELLAFVDGVSLVDLVSGYEHAAGFDVPGQYAGLVIDHFTIGDLADYLTGRPEAAYRTQSGVIALLCCDCGELGCWPLEARIVVDDEHVTWREFTQPFRPRRDYAGFGPFVFRRNRYDSAVRAAVGRASRGE